MLIMKYCLFPSLPHYLLTVNQVQEKVNGLRKNVLSATHTAAPMLSYGPVKYLACCYQTINCAVEVGGLVHRSEPVSYTHLDVYKRQVV